ncbi:MAG: hypothetical protein E7268_07245 [Lachnospiraceae bacterium]|nr:hypothetical protein [Lachnospiraceae bacterium]
MEKENETGIKDDMPIGFGLSLAANTKAMNCFSAMPDDEKRAVIEASRNQHTREDMERFVTKLGNNFEE